MNSFKRYTPLLIGITLGLGIAALISNLRQDFNIKKANKKIEVLECSIYWNDSTQKIRFSTYPEYKRCLG